MLARQRRLEDYLSAAPTPPVAEFAAPQLPPVRRGGRLLRLPPVGWAAAAAAGLAFAAALWTTRNGIGGGEHGEPAWATVRIDRVVDSAESPPPADESLLALTEGVEALAMRRPTEIR
jgi:hypothetical protein